MEFPKGLNQRKSLIWMFFLIICSRFSVTNSKPFEYQQYVLQWQPGVCRTSIWPCIKPIRQVFTVHGLWPSNFSGVDVNCKDGPRYLGNQVSLIEQELKKCWPDMLRDDDHFFWSKEWESHGRCFLNVFGDQFQYFNQAVRLCNRYNTWIKDILALAGIYPSDIWLVSRDDVADSIHRAIGKRPVLRCAGGYYPGLGDPSPSSGSQIYVSRKSYQKRQLKIPNHMTICNTWYNGNLLFVEPQTGRAKNQSNKFLQFMASGQAISVEQM